MPPLDSPEQQRQQQHRSPLPSRFKSRARLRSTTGCTTCRRRHIKCDEKKPTCANCGKKGRSCQYTSTAAAAAAAAAAAPSDPFSSATSSRLLLQGSQQACLRGSYHHPRDYNGGVDVLAPSSPHWGNLGSREVIPDQSRAEYSPPERTAPATTTSSITTTSTSTTRDENVPAEERIRVNRQGDGGQVADPAGPKSPFVDQLESSVSPFLATLGSVLLDADVYEDVQLPRLPVIPAQDGSAGTNVDNVHLESSEVLRTETRAKLAGIQSTVFRNYVDNVSLWIDSFSRDQPFHRLVPNLALYCPVLLHSCLALSAKQLELVGLSASYRLQKGDAVHYYRLALNAIRRLLHVSDSARSDEVLAACIVLSTYEMLDVVGESLGSHLVGVASLLESRQVYGDAGGIRGSCYWTWYRHEVWSAFRSGCCLSLDESYWSPPTLDSFHHLEPEDIANRVIFLLGQCVNFCNDQELRSRTMVDEWLRRRVARSKYLDQELEKWKRMLPPTMLSFAADESSAQRSLGVFGSICFLSPHSAIAHQVYHASKILLCLHRVQNQPTVSGLANWSFLSLKDSLETHRKEIFLTANSGIPNAWSLVACQCLYIAGQVTEGAPERQRTLDLMDQCQRDSGRKTGYLSADLKRLWAS